MRALITNTAIGAAVAFGFGGSALGATEHAHDRGYGVQEATLELNQGRKWATDESLREGMENIRAALYANIHLFHGADDSNIDYGALAAAVSGEVALIVQNCKLEPLADAQLHKLIGQIMSGAEAMRGKEQGVARRDGAIRVAEALGEYARQFEHPGWF